MAWVSPTGYNDPDSKWSNEALAYDDNLETQAWTFNQGYYLELLLDSPISCDKVRSYWGYANPPNVDIDVYYSGAWHNIHAGAIAKAQWVETEIGSTQTVEKARAKINTGTTHWLVEFDFNEVAGGQTHEASATMSGTGSLAAKGAYLHQAAATMAGAGSLSAKGGLVQLGAGTAAGTGALAALGRLILGGKLTMSGTGSLSAAGTVIEAATVYGSATLSGTGSLAAAARLILAATATLSGTGALSARAVYTVIAKATLSGEGSLAAAGTVVPPAAYVYGSATMSGTGTLTVVTPLMAAQRALHRLPYVEAKVYDYSQGIKRLYFTRLYQGSEPDNHHGIAFDGEGSMHRIRADTGDKLYYQKITSPGPSSDYSQWTEIAADCAGPCAIAASPAGAPPAQAGKIYIFYRKTNDTLRKYYSHNYGVDWTNAELSTYTTVLSLAACWWGTTDTVVCLALKSFQVNRILLDTSDQSTDEKTWSDGVHPWLTTYGIGATYNAALDNCDIVIAAKESDTPYNHFDLFRTRLSETKNFLALESFLMAPDGEDITYEYPDCHLPASPQEYESTRVLAVEKFAGTTAYTRPLACHLVKGTTWSAATFTEPRPFLPAAAFGEGGPAHGLRLQSTASYWWISTPAGVWAAPRPAADPLDLTGRIVAITQNRPGSLAITLDNSKGHYNVGEGLVPSLINKRSEIHLKLGYTTTLGNEAGDAGTYWIDSWEYSHGANRSLFTITALDGWGLLERWTARYQMRWNKDEDDPRSVWQILYHVLARVGIRLTNTPPKPQSSAIDNFYPDFAIAPGTKGGTAINTLLSFVPDQLVFRGQEAFTKNPLASEQSCYTYGVGAGLVPAHPIISGTYARAVTTSRSRALGRDEGDRIVEEALDWDLLDLAVDILEQVYDPNLENATRTQERADALLRGASLRAQPATITVPVNVNQQLLDVVDVTDPRCGISGQKYRVLATRTDYDSRKRRYDQTLTLGAP